MENIGNHKDMKLVTIREKYTKYVMKPNFKVGYPFSKELFAIEMEKAKVKMNKPVYLKQSILNLSKTLICEFHYDYMQLKYGNKVRLCYVGSFVYEIETRFSRSYCKRRRDKVGYK